MGLHQCQQKIKLRMQVKPFIWKKSLGIVQCKVILYKTETYMSLAVCVLSEIHKAKVIDDDDGCSSGRGSLWMWAKLLFLVEVAAGVFAQPPAAPRPSVWTHGFM